MITSTTLHITLRYYLFGSDISYKADKYVSEFIRINGRQETLKLCNTSLFKLIYGNNI